LTVPSSALRQQTMLDWRDLVQSSTANPRRFADDSAAVGQLHRGSLKYRDIARVGLFVRVSRDREQGFQRIVSNDFRGS
jgi:hypothetical protein